jgi:hypothetical protein
MPYALRSNRLSNETHLQTPEATSTSTTTHNTKTRVVDAKRSQTWPHPHIVGILAMAGQVLCIVIIVRYDPLQTGVRVPLLATKE